MEVARLPVSHAACAGLHGDNAGMKSALPRNGAGELIPWKSSDWTRSCDSN